MVEKDMKANNAITSQAYADFLDAAFASEFLMWQAEAINPEDWAWASHEHAEDFAYGDLPKLIPIDPHPDAAVKVCSDTNRIGNSMFHKHLRVDSRAFGHGRHPPRNAAQRCGNESPLTAARTSRAALPHGTFLCGAMAVLRYFSYFLSVTAYGDDPTDGILTLRHRMSIRTDDRCCAPLLIF